MEKCWANSIGGCSEILSGEHLISKGILEKMGKMVKVEGFNWCKTESKEIGMNALQSKILCGNHNNLLSNYDSEAINFFEAINKWVKQSERFSNNGFSVKKIPIQYFIDGLLIERWFLKTMVNLTLVSTDKVTIPFDVILPVLYGDKRFEKPFGFGQIIKRGSSVVVDGIINFRPFVDQENILCGGTFVFNGFKVGIILPIEGVIINNQLAIDIDGSLNGSQINWHNEVISEAMKRFRKTYTVQKIVINWAD